MTHSEDQQLMIAEYARGDISKARLRSLEAALRDDDSFRDKFIEYMNVDAALGDLAALSESEIAQLDTTASGSGQAANLVPETHAELMSPPLAEPDNRRAITLLTSRRHWKKIAALTACLIVAVAFWWRYGTDRNLEDNVAETGDEAEQLVPDSNSPAVATVVQLADAQWGDGRRLAVGDRVSTGVLHLEAGIVHLRIDSGVGVTLEGPAEFEVTSAEVTRLHSGLLTATVPPGAEGFRVDTPSAQVVDLGTAFGIEQRRDGTSTVSVFDGEVEIVRADDSDKRLLTEGETVLLAADGSVSDVEFASQPFEKLWPTASGIAGSTGAFRFAPPWPRGLRRIQSDTEILVLPEGYAEKLKEPCPVDIAESELIESGIPAGRRVRSFLLQFNPVDPADHESTSNQPGSRMRRIEGSITFARPVIGLIVSTKTLTATDEVFSLRRGPIRPFARGLELSPPRTADVVVLSKDRRTLTLKLAVFDQFSDHVRVIVDASLGEVKNRSAVSR